MKINELLNEDWNKVNKQDKTDGLSKKAVKAYRRENPGSKLQTAVTTKPSKLKPGSKAAKRRKSFCARMSGNKGPMKKPNGKPTPKALALRRWNCESIEEMRQLIETAERVINEEKQRLDPKCWKSYKKQDTKMKDGVRVNNCVPKESLTEDDVEDFLKAGGQIQYGKPQKGPRKPGLSLASKHIGGSGDKMKASRSGRGANTQGKPVVSVEENFANGKNPQDKGDSKRHGVPTKASVSTLRKVAKQGGRKGQLAHWMANMKAGKAKK